MFFPVRNKKFPIPIAGNSSKEVSRFNGFVQAGRGASTEIPCIFPRSGNSDSGDAFAVASQRSHLVAVFPALFRPWLLVELFQKIGVSLQVGSGYPVSWHRRGPPVDPRSDLIRVRQILHGQGSYEEKHEAIVEPRHVGSPGPGRKVRI
jgi:hypothetical protein